MSTSAPERLLTNAAAWVVGDAAPLSKFLSEKQWISAWLPVKFLDSVLRGVAQVCFGNNPISGLLILAGLFLSSVTVGVGALACAAIATVSGKVLRQPDAIVSNGLCVYSSVLVGTVTTALYPIFIEEQGINAKGWIYMFFAAFFCVLIGMALTTLMSPLSLPVFTLPFNVTTSILFVVLRCSLSDAKGELDSEKPTENITIESPPTFSFIEVMHGSLLSAGQVYAVQDSVCSVLILLGLFVYSPILSTASYLGGLIGTFIAIVVAGQGYYPAIVAGIWGYNGFLCAGCVVFFLNVTWKSMFLIVLSTASSVFLQIILIPVFAANNLPVFTMPFCLASILLLLVTVHEGLAVQRADCLTYPEEHAWKSWNRRFEVNSKTPQNGLVEEHPL